MLRNKILYAYNLQECFEDVLTANLEPYGTQTTVATLLTVFGLTYTIPTGSKIEILWKKIINRFYSETIIITDDIQVAKVQDWFIKFLNVYELTYDYYETLINLYEAKKTNLLDKVQSLNSASVKFNDTPQNASGDFTGDDYVTNYTKTEGESSSDFATVMTRLREIQDDYKRLWEDWLNEFHRLFIEDNFEEVA